MAEVDLPQVLEACENLEEGDSGICEYIERSVEKKGMSISRAISVLKNRYGGGKVTEELFEIG